MRPSANYFGLVVAAILAIALASCSGGGGGGGGGGGSSNDSGGGGGDTPPPTTPEVLPLGVLKYPAHLTCGTQLASEPLKFIFSRSMDGQPVTNLSGAFSESNQEWSPTALSDDTLTITGIGNWNPGAFLLTFDTADEDGNPLTVWYTPTMLTSLSQPTLYQYYVSGDAGSDTTGDGQTPATAYQTIGKAINQAGTDEAPSALVLVAAAPGSVVPNTVNPEDSGLPFRGYDAGATLNILNDGVSLCGGFSPDFAERDPVSYPTVIASTATGGTGGGVTNPLATVAASTSVSALSVLDGFTIVAPGTETISPFTESGYTGALTVAGGLQVRNNKLVAGSPINSVIALVRDNAGAQSVFTNNYLKGSDTPGTEAYGLLVSNAVPVFDSGYIGSQTYGIKIDNDPLVVLTGTVTISNSDIDGGALSGNSNYGIYVNRGAVDILNNPEINGGGVAGSGSSYGIYFAGGSGTVTNNTIFAGTSATSAGISISSLAGAVTVTNSDIHTGPGDDVLPDGTVLYIGIEFGGAAGGTLTNNVVWGGDGGDGIAIEDAGTATTVESNWIQGGSNAFSSVAIRSSGSPATRSYLRNQIIGGVSGGANTGILLEVGTIGVIVRANVMAGCSDYTGFSLQDTCIAIDNNGANNQFLNNTINGGLGVSAVGPASTVLRQGSTASGTIVRSNIFLTSKGGVLNAAGGRCIDLTPNAAPATSFTQILHNDFFSCGIYKFYDQSADVSFSTANPYIAGTPSLDSAGNVQDVNPAFVLIGTNPGRLGTSSVDWHLTAATPDSVRTGGSGCSGYVDYDGTPYGFESPLGDAAMGAFVSPTQNPPDGC